MFMKKTVVLALSEPMAKGLHTIEEVYGRTILDRTKNLVITSARDGQHMKGSKHYTGDAVDLRTRDLTKQEQKDLWQNLVNYLGPKFDVVLESDHIHVEFDPK